MKLFIELDDIFIKASDIKAAIIETSDPNNFDVKYRVKVLTIQGNYYCGEWHTYKGEAVEQLNKFVKKLEKILTSVPKGKPVFIN